MKINQHLRYANQICLTLLVAIVALSSAFAAEERANPPAVAPAAVQILRRMSDYLENLKMVSVYTQSTVEDLDAAGHRVDSDISARSIIVRPDKILTERRGDLIDQDFYYDGKSLTLCNPSDKVYATVSAPATIDEMLHFTRDKLGFSITISDLVYTNFCFLLMNHVTYAAVVDKAFINGIKCDHLIFSRPGVEFQLWVAESEPPLPYKYVVTDTGTPALLSVSTVISQWNLKPDVSAGRFTFVPPPGYKPITFMPFASNSAAHH